MNHQITAVIVDDETILLDGRKLVGGNELGEALRSALQRDPNFVLVIGSRPTDHYKAIGTLIYSSQRAGVPVENLRFTTDEGEVVSLSELQAQNARRSE